MTNRKSQDTITLLKGSEILYKNLFNNTRKAIFICDLKGNIINANKSAVTFTGYSYTELTRMSIYELHITEGSRLISKRLQALLKDRAAIPHLEMELIKKDGTGVSIGGDINPIIFYDELAGIQVVVEDITERKQIEKALKLAEQNFRNSVEDSPLGIRIVTREGELLHANKAILDIYGYNSIEELKNIPAKERYTPQSYAEHKERIKRRKMRLPVPDNYEIDIVRKNGETRNLRVFRQKVVWDGRPQFQSIYQDITEQKRAEKALQRSEERYRTLVENTYAGIAACDLEGKLNFVNSALCQTIGYSESELLGKYFTSFIHPDDKERIRNIFQGAFTMAAKKVISLEFRAIHKQGKTLYLYGSPTTLRDREKIVGAIVFIKDVTEYRKTFTALRESEEKLQRMFESITDAITVTDLNGIIIDANEAAVKMNGYGSKGKLLGTNAFKLIAQPQRDKVLINLRETMKNGLVKNIEYTFLRADGSEFPGKLNISVLKDAYGNPSGFIAIIRDMTRHKQADMALRYSEEFNTSLLANSPNPMIVINGDTSIRYVNPAMIKLTGFCSKEIIGRKPPYPWWVEERYDECYRNITRIIHSRGIKYEQIFKRKNGEKFLVEINTRKVNADTEPFYFFSIWTDLTEQKQFRENMQYYISQVNRAQEEERKRIAREIHDDTLQSLAAVALELDSITAKRGGLSQDITLRLEQLRTMVNGVIRELRRFSHELRPGDIDQVGLIPAVETMVEELQEDCSIRCTFKITGTDKRLPPDTELALFRITQEALRNVRRHSEATNAKVILAFTSERLKLTIHDNGKGFKIPKILGDLVTNDKLGLIGIQERVRLLGGKLIVKPEVGKGTTIIVDIGI